MCNDLDEISEPDDAHFKLRLCPCGSGEPRYELVDAAGIFCTYVCVKCEDEQRKKYRPEVFDETHPYASSGLEEDLEIDY